VSAQAFDLEEQTSRQDSAPLAGLRLFKTPPTNGRNEENRESHNESMEEILERKQGVPSLKPQAAAAVESLTNSGPTRGTSKDPSRSLADFAHSDPRHGSPNPSQKKLARIDDSMAIEKLDIIDSSSRLAVGLMSSEKVPPLLSSSIQGTKVSVGNHEPTGSNSSRISNGSITNTEAWFDVKQLFLTANESTRVIPIARPIEKNSPGLPVDSFKKQATPHTFTPPGSLVRMPPTSQGASEQAGHHVSIPTRTEVELDSQKNHSTPAGRHSHIERSATSTIPVVTPGELSATHDTHSRLGNVVSEGLGNYSVADLDMGGTHARLVTPSASMQLDSQNGASLDQGLNFEELHAKFLSDIRDLEDIQDGNTSQLLVMQARFATSYAESLKDQGNLLDLIGNLEKVAATVQDTISRFQACNE
jgi:hypothetical protein